MKLGILLNNKKNEKLTPKVEEKTTKQLTAEERLLLKPITFTQADDIVLAKAVGVQVGPGVSLGAGV